MGNFCENTVFKINKLLFSVRMVTYVKLISDDFDPNGLEQRKDKLQKIVLRVVRKMRQTLGEGPLYLLVSRKFVNGMLHTYIL